MKRFFLLFFAFFVGYIIGYESKYITRNFINNTIRVILNKNNSIEQKIPQSIEYKEVNCPASSFQIAYFSSNSEIV